MIQYANGGLGIMTIKSTFGAQYLACPIRYSITAV